MQSDLYDVAEAEDAASVSEFRTNWYTSNWICRPFMTLPSRANGSFMLGLMLAPDSITERAETSLAPKYGNAPRSLHLAKVTPGASIPKNTRRCRHDHLSDGLQVVTPRKANWGVAPRARAEPPPPQVVGIILHAIDIVLHLGRCCSNNKIYWAALCFIIVMF